jgi:hypothetical protein
VEEAPEQSNALFSFQGGGMRHLVGCSWGPECCSGSAPLVAVCRALAKDPADERFLRVGAASQQEQIAGPNVCYQIRSRKAIITLYCQNSIKE